MKTTIGKNIYSFRKKLGVSQRDIAEYCGVSRELISLYETGNREVSLLHLEKVSEFLNVDFETFLEEDPVEIKPDLALAFRADELSGEDRGSIVLFKKIVKNYLKMKKIDSDGI